ncbi:MAG: DUF3416 domain-containing protein [Endomicrobiia bacterium]|nr:DUF3416 domain-containing protein [Endomicrobiia bacterium]
MAEKKRMIIAVHPEIAGGDAPVKTETDSFMDVSAVVEGTPGEVFLKKKPAGATIWKKIPMNRRSDGRWHAAATFEKTGYYDYTVEARASDDEPGTDGAPLKKPGAAKKRGGKSVENYPQKLSVMVEQPRARFSAWYEIFPRSQGATPGKSGTFRDVVKRLDYIKDLGFDVLYMAPIHPIGFTKKKGPNNSLAAGPGDPGSCWAIGNEAGGHKAVHPDLGTLADFRALVEAAERKGLAVALDIGLQCSPDHPYVKEHPEWFHHEADGTIKCAENPPKKYEDVYPLNFYPVEGQDEMWNEMKSIFEFWVEQGVKIFRIDNPHTKPTEFWQWAIAEVKKKEPEAVFLSEAFTNYEKLEELAAVGFSQSYGYFTWRNGKNELIEYFLKLTQSHLKDFLRMNLFVNTPDILPTILKEGGRPAFMSRIALAATLSSCYGMYNGYELCENEAVHGKEEYWHSEKYEYKIRDWDAPGNIKDYIARLNKIRRSNPALQEYSNLRFANSTNDHVIAYYKVSPDGKNRILAAVNLNPRESQDARVSVPLEDFSIPTGEDYIAEDLISGRKYVWRDRENYVRLDPNKNPAAIFRITPEVAGGTLKSAKTIKSDGASESEKTARGDAKIFFEIRIKVVEHNDPYARRELSAFYMEHIAPRTYAGETFDEDYTNAINRVAVREGFRSIAHANATTPGH